MNTQSPYVDANNSYGVIRSFNEYTLWASPSFFNHASNYVQRPIQSNLHASTFYDTNNMHHMYSNSHASATPQIVMPMNNMVSSVNKFETPHVRISNAMQESVSPFYSSASNVQYTNTTMPINERIGHATTSYSASYSQPSNATPHVSNFLAPYTTVDVHDSAPHLHGHSQISENSARVHMPSPNVVAYSASSTQL